MNSTLQAPTTRHRQTPPRPASRAALFLLAALIVVAAAWTLRWAAAPPTIAETLASGSDRISPGFVDPTEVDRLIAAYERRVTEHTDALDYRTLGFLYLEDARASGDVSRYDSARDAFTRAVDLFPSDPSSRVGLASTEYALHDFAAAGDQARLVYDATQRADALAILADASAALGDYDQAASRLGTLVEVSGDHPAVMVRRAESARLDGRADEAMQLSRDAAGIASQSDNPRLRSWYRAFAAQMAFYLGHYEEGLGLAEQARADDPNSHTAAIASARLLAATGDRGDAIDLYESVVDIMPDPTFLAELGDLYLLTDQTGEAAATFATIDAAAALAAGAGLYDRVLAGYLADHGQDPTRAVEIAQGDLGERQDVGAYDTLAWALYAAERFDEAAEASDLALARGTLDARFLYHAGMIAAARGEVASARTYLQAALDLSPGFQPLQSQRAADALGELK